MIVVLQVLVALAIYGPIVAALAWLVDLAAGRLVGPYFHGQNAPRRLPVDGIAEGWIEGVTR
jgi:hypothetical protein